MCCEDAACKDRDDSRHQVDKGYPGHFQISIDEGQDGCLDGIAAWIGQEEAVLRSGSFWVREVDEWLDRAEVSIDWLPGEEKEHPQQGRQEAVQEVG